ncbi:MAG TPA: PRC-barrel domain-containing protein [Methanomassiliicoccales archaeon]
MVRMEDVMGKEVISSDAIIVGSVEGVSIDPEHWRISALRVTVTKGLEMAMDKKKKTIGSSRAFINTGAVASVSDMITVSVSLVDIKGALVNENLWPLNFGNLTGMRVICKKGRQIGYVDNLVFDPKDNWKISYIDVRLDKATKDDLNIKKKMMSGSGIVIRTSDIRTIGDMVMLNIDIEELKQWLENRPASLKG